MKQDKYGYVWDPAAWAEKRSRQHQKELNRRTAQTETEYEKYRHLWFLKQSMLKRFGHREWMNGIVDPDTLQWDENGNRLRKPGARQLAGDHTIIPAPKPKRRLRH